MPTKNIYVRSISIPDIEDYYIIKDMINESYVKNYIKSITYDLRGLFMVIHYCTSESEHAKVESILIELLTNYYD